MRQRRHDAVEQRFLETGLDRPGTFPIGAQEMGRVVLGDEPDLACRRPPAVEYDLASMRGSLVNSRIRTRPVSSSPTTPTSTQRAPSETMLRATLPAPPTMVSCRCTAITGVGASGEMRVTLP